MENVTTWEGETVRQICEAAGCGDINLMQRAYYNRHYKYHGAKVQHVLQADRMVYSLACPIRNHDAMVLRNSAIHEMLCALYINGDPDRPVHVVTDKAYGRNATISSLITPLLSLRSCYLLIALFKLSLIEDIKRLVWLFY